MTDKTFPEGVRVLLLADTHLGLDLPLRPRVERRRRGDDFFANFGRALRPAMAGEVDLVVHGGDLLYRSQVPAILVEMVMAPLKALADKGVPIILVPGNHERSHIPFRLLAVHPLIHIFDEPATFTVEARGLTLALSGFPYDRQVRSRFPALLEATGWRNTKADVKVLCLHQAFEGATVGPVGYTFRSGDDVVRAQDLPQGFAAALAGHIHRHQILNLDLRRRPLAAPVLYPGSIERTSFAEKDEAKGYLTLELTARGLRAWTFHDLPARPMILADLDGRGRDRLWLVDQLTRLIAKAPADGVVKVRIRGRLEEDALAALNAPALRSLAPPTMNLDVALISYRKGSLTRSVLIEE